MKFLVIATGGTIASVATPDGLRPGLSGDEIVSRCSGISRGDSVDVIDLFAKDSTNITPDDWFAAAECVNGHASYFDASIVLHGTDTMAWTAAALSLLTDSVVVMTGSMLPSGAEGSDADANLSDAFAFARLLSRAGRNETALAFGGKLHRGGSVSKIDTHAADSFASAGCPPLGYKEGGECKLSGFVPEKAERSRPDRKLKAERVALVPIFPGMSAGYFRAVMDTGPSAILIEGFGGGGVPFQDGETNLLPCIEEAVKRGMKVVLGTSCPSGGAAPEVYEVGLRALRAGAVSAGNLTREAVMVRLMLGVPV